jgi:hypothetical protein
LNIFVDNRDDIVHSNKYSKDEKEKKPNERKSTTYPSIWEYKHKTDEDISKIEFTDDWLKWSQIVQSSEVEACECADCLSYDGYIRSNIFFMMSSCLLSFKKKICGM